MNKFHVIVAMDLNKGIGKNNSIPWRIKEDMTYFKNMTTCPVLEEIWDIYKNQRMIEAGDVLIKKSDIEMNAVIMGRKTWDSLPPKFRPLPNRRNFVLSRTLQPNIPNCYTTLDEIMEVISKDESIKNTFVIGGAQIYEEALKHPACGDIFITQIAEVYECDTFFPELLGTYRVTWGPTDFKDLKFKFMRYEKGN
jgi:dihydrofolate reductase